MKTRKFPQNIVRLASFFHLFFTFFSASFLFIPSVNSSSFKTGISALAPKTTFSQRLDLFLPTRYLKPARIYSYGDEHDGIIEFPAITQDGGIIETGYYFGDDKPKNIIGISSQVGCPVHCRFCELGGDRFQRNLTAEEIFEQALLMLLTVRDLGIDIDLKSHKISFGKTGEPLLNQNLVEGMKLLSVFPFSFKVSTVFPQSRTSWKILNQLADFASTHPFPVQLQISLLSTSEKQRREITGIPLASFRKIRKAGELWKRKVSGARDINLSIIVSEGIECNPEDVVQIFPPELFRFRIRDYVPTTHGGEYGLKPVSRERIREIRDSFRKKGYRISDFPTPTETEWKHTLAANVTRRRFLEEKQAMSGKPGISSA